MSPKFTRFLVKFRNACLGQTLQTAKGAKLVLAVCLLALTCH